MPARYEYVNGNIKYKHEYAYTTGTLPETPKKTIEYHYDDSSWSDVLTSVSETTYPTSNTSTASVNSLVGDDAHIVPSTTASDALAKSLLGNNCKKVDLFSASLVKGRGTVEDGGGILSSESNISINSTTNSSTLFSMEVDEIGNMTKFNGYDFNWNGRRLESISQDGVELISYEYNIDGQRVSKNYEGITTQYFYNGSILAGEKTGNNVIIYMYDNNGDIFGFTYNGTEYYYIKNAQNDVVAIADASGNVVVRYYYNAWGEIIDCVDNTTIGLSSINPITYRSYYNDNVAGMDMYYLNSRYYMADWGRFVSADALLSTEQGMIGNNMFAYCGNNPVLRSDTSGNFWETVFDVVSLCVSIVDVASNPRDPGAWVGLVADAVDLIPFVTGVGEVVRSINVTRKALDTVDTLNDARKAAKTASNTYQAAKTGKKVANTGQATKKLHRPYIRKSVIETVENRAARSADGLFLDANTKTPIVGKYDLGHVYGHEFWRERDLAMSKGWTQKQFNDYMNNPDFYQIENPKYNRAHIFEMR